MATDLTALIAKIAIAVTATAKKSLDLAVPQAGLEANKVFALAFGTGADQANQIWWDRRTLAKGADEGTNLDLAGTLSNAFGATITFANVKAILVFNRSDETLDEHTATDAEISVGGADANEFQGPFKAATDAIKVPAGGAFVALNPAADGWAVTVDTADILLVTNEDADDEALYDIVLIGESA